MWDGSICFEETTNDVVAVVDFIILNMFIIRIKLVIVFCFYYDVCEGHCSQPLPHLNSLKTCTLRYLIEPGQKLLILFVECKGRVKFFQLIDLCVVGDDLQLRLHFSQFCIH